jgi:hypothetical protein
VPHLPEMSDVFEQLLSNPGYALNMVMQKELNHMIYYSVTYLNASESNKDNNSRSNMKGDSKRNKKYIDATFACAEYTYVVDLFKGSITYWHRETVDVEGKASAEFLNHNQRRLFNTTWVPDNLSKLLNSLSEAQWKLFTDFEICHRTSIELDCIKWGPKR